jgi:hypothetical protein
MPLRRDRGHAAKRATFQISAQRSRFLRGHLLCAAIGDYLCHVLLTLLAFGLIVRALEPLARKRGWGSEGRLMRYLSRPRFIDESKQRILNWGSPTSW